MGYRDRSIYILSAPASITYRDELDVHLTVLEKDRGIKVLRPSGPGDTEIQPIEFVESADIVVVLLDADLVARYGQELDRAKERRTHDHLHLIWVRTRPVVYDLAFVSLPKDKERTLAHYSPTPRGDVYCDVVHGVCDLIDRERPSESSVDCALPNALYAQDDGDPRAQASTSKDLPTHNPEKRESREAIMIEASHSVRERDMIRLNINGDRFRVLGQIAWGWELRWRAWDTALRRSVIIGAPTEDIDPRSKEVLISRLLAWSALPKDPFARVIQEPREERGCHYIVEDLEGDLQQLILKDSIEQEAILPLLCRLASLVSDLHEKHKLVHGGLEPRSVLIGAQGKVKLGILDPLLGAALEVEPISTRVTISPYEAPERGEVEFDRNPRPYHLDVFSLGMIALFALGRKNPRARNADEVDRLISALHCHDLVKDVLRTAVSPILTQRYPNATGFLKALVAAYGASRTHAFVEWRDIPDGKFEMGTSDDGVRPHWAPIRTVEVRAFKMARYPVTQGLYAKVMLHNPSQWPQNRNAPVNCVSFHDALEFCNRLSMLENLAPVYRFEANKILCDWRSDGYRLPTEAEWEFAARGRDSRRFPWGDELRPMDVCWNGDGNSTGESNRRGPWSVGERELASPFGVQELIGNVWEWCWDFFAYPKDLPGGLDPTGPSQPSPIPENLESRGTAFRMLRGGSWTDHDPLWLRAYARLPDDESARDANIGFRVVRGAKPHIDAAPPGAREKAM